LLDDQYEISDIVHRSSLLDPYRTFAAPERVLFVIDVEDSATQATELEVSVGVCRAGLMQGAVRILTE